MPKKSDNRYHDLRKPAKQAYPDDETKFQREVSEWLKKELYNRGLPQLYFHVPNERYATPQAMARLKAQGVMSGVSDVILLLPMCGYHGAICELKSRSGGPRPEQRQFLNDCADRGYFACVINTVDTFKEVFTYYLNNEKQ